MKFIIYRSDSKIECDISVLEKYDVNTRNLIYGMDWHKTFYYNKFSPEFLIKNKNIFDKYLDYHADDNWISNYISHTIVELGKFNKELVCMKCGTQIFWSSSCEEEIMDKVLISD